MPFVGRSRWSVGDKDSTAAAGIYRQRRSLRIAFPCYTRTLLHILSTWMGLRGHSEAFDDVESQKCQPSLARNSWFSRRRVSFSIFRRRISEMRSCFSAFSILFSSRKSARISFRYSMRDTFGFAGSTSSGGSRLGPYGNVPLPRTHSRCNASIGLFAGLLCEYNFGLSCMTRSSPFLASVTCLHVSGSMNRECSES